MTSEGHGSPVRRLLHQAKEFLTHWTVAGAIVVLTGFGPEHWFADMIGHLAPGKVADALHGFDVRIVLVAIGVAIIAWDVVRRGAAQKPGALPAGPLETTVPVRTSGQRGGDRKETGPAVKPRFSVADIDLALPDKPSIAVLPFTNMSGDPEQEYFSDGVSEDVMTELSRFHSLFVIARNSAFTYKGCSVDVRTIAKELGVRYVLEGSLRKAANRVRVTAQLIDTLSGNHLWAERYDRDLPDIFAIEEELTRRIVSAITSEVERAEWSRAERKSSRNLGAYDHALRSRALDVKATARADRALREEALMEARNALKIDANCIEALLALSWVQFGRIFYRTADEIAAAWDEAMAAAARAIELDPTGAVAHAVRGNLLLYAPGGPQHGEAKRSLMRAYELNPNDATVLQSLGFCEALSGEPDASLQRLNDALRLNPRDPRRASVHAAMMVAAFSARDYAATLHWALQSASERPNVVQNHMFAAQAYVGLDELDKARAALETAMKLGAEFVRVRLEGWSVYAKAEDRRRQITFLRIAASLEDPGAADSLR